MSETGGSASTDGRRVPRRVIDAGLHYVDERGEHSELVSEHVSPEEDRCRLAVVSNTESWLRAAIGLGDELLGLVLCHPDGRPFHPDRFSREFDRRVERHGLRRIRLHDLRDTWATLALQGGVHPKVVQERLGHASISITLDTYSHVSQPMKTEAAEIVARLIQGGAS